MTGRWMVLPQHLLYRTTDHNLVNATTTHQYIDLRKHLQNAFSFAQRNIERATNSAKTYYDLKTMKKGYEIGDKIYLYNSARNQVKEGKFLPSWRGPFTLLTGSLLWHINCIFHRMVKSVRDRCTSITCLPPQVQITFVGGHYPPTPPW